MKQTLLCGFAAIALVACGGGADTTAEAPANDAPAASTAAAPAAGMRDQIKIVGSSTVYPFSATVAENFGRSTSFPTPIVESTGSGGGLKLFCTGIGENYPDITNASRRIKASEVERCAENGIDEIVEVKVGFDGIVLANSRKADRMEVSLRDVYLALARDVPDGNGGFKPNEAELWSDVNPALPARRIEVMGPPPTSGTRDAFVELAMEGGCSTFDSLKALKSSDKDSYKARCHTMREDEAFIEMGENDNLIVNKLNANPEALGIFGFSFLDQNAESVQGSIVDGVEPTFDNIADGSYPVSRSLYFYVKKDHIGVVPGIEEFLAEFQSPRAAGPDGYLAEKGLIPMQPAEQARWKASVSALEPLTLD